MKRNGKKNIAILLLAAFIMCLFTGCGESGKYGNPRELLTRAKNDESIAAFRAPEDSSAPREQVVLCPNWRNGDDARLAKGGKYLQTFAAVKKTGEYSDSANQSIDLYPQTAPLSLSNAKEGDYVTFGSYEQDNDLSNGKEPIEWLVLENTGKQLLVISRYGLDAKPYNKEYTLVTWETCSLRSWLNNDFYNSAFNETERGMIATTWVTADKNPDYSTNPGNATTDKVFLLSIAEANKYFTSDEARMCAPTAYAKEQGAWTNDSYKLASGEAACWWRLRSPGDLESSASDVDHDGGILYHGRRVSASSGTVRPALYINLVLSSDHISYNDRGDKQVSADSLQTAQVGDYVTFGYYEQDNNRNNGKEPVEWLVLDRTDSQLLVISRYALDAQLYNTTPEDVTWETCSLRSWLNKDFYNSAFNGTEQGMIAQTRVSPDKNPEYDTNPGNTTYDNVFLLSIAEANNYFNSGEVRMCALTAYANAQGALTFDRYKLASGETACGWWLRSPGDDQRHASCVYYDGDFDYSGSNVYYSLECVRPALYINLGS